MLTVLKDNLATALSLTGEAIGRDRNVPIRSYIRLTALEGGLALSGTDLITAVVLNIGAKVEQPLDHLALLTHAKAAQASISAATQAIGCFDAASGLGAL